MSEEQAPRRVLTPAEMKARTILESLVGTMNDQRRPLEALWLQYRINVMPLDAPPAAVEAMRHTFFFGALQVFRMGTVAGIEQMKAVNEELGAYMQRPREDGT